MKKKYIEAYMKVAYAFANLSHCKRKKVGCIVVKDERIISIGYNGTYPGHCNDCEDSAGVSLATVIHAEANAIAKLAKSHESGDRATVFITYEPCLECAKILASVGIKDLYYAEHKTTKMGGVEYLKSSGIPVYHYPIAGEPI